MTAPGLLEPQVNFDPIAPQTKAQRFYAFAKKEATFFRVHLLAFAIVPLIFSGIFYACNGRFPVSYLDSLFLCYSAMTVTGLSTINLSTTTAIQQALLFFLMMIGDITMVSWVMVLVRKHYFRTHCEYVASLRRPKRRGALPLLQRTRTMLINAISPPKDPRPLADVDKPKEITDSPFSMAHLTELPTTKDVVAVTEPTPRPTGLSAFGFGNVSYEGDRHSEEIDRIMSDDVRTFTSSPKAASVALSPPSPTSPDEPGFPRTISFSSAARPDLHRRKRRGMTMLTTNQLVSPPSNDAGGRHVAKYEAYGGFPGPITVAQRALKRLAPTTYRKLERKLTIPYTTTLNGGPAPLVSSPVVSSPLARHNSLPRNGNGNGELVGEGETPMEKFIADFNTKVVTWLSFPLKVGRNSNFEVDELSDEEVEEIGGAEYKALRVLSYLVPCYFVLTQVFAYILFVPWISVTHTYDGVFEAQPRLIQKPWFGLFQVMGAYTGGGLSLVDMGMVPFQSAYLMIFALMFVILAGNHALPIFLRFVIWVGYKFSRAESNTRKASDTHKAMEFLIDHPRRCFIYLFPSHQTWFLLICLVAFSAVEWAAFEVLNIGLPAFESISQGPRVLAGLFQGLAARASGFSIVPVANLAPAIQFLYAVMMYIAVAMSIRATNVYEERSLGVFEAPPADEDEEPGDLEALPPRERVGKYLDWHLRRQVSNDIWWLVWAIFLIAIIERRNLMDEDKKWFDLFRVLFELVSAFGGIGLTLGVPYDNFSFCGAMRPLSKLVIIVIMVRGRHRGLPLAVDRAVLLPRELNRAGEGKAANGNVNQPPASPAPAPVPPSAGDIDQPVPTPVDAPPSGAKPRLNM
ncbi:hypothetical protein EYR40_010154 [Pleurotus pulmonarius]|nr:hypothetical protein EYR36_010449 [Pleurotus pulmonarius]KAF4588601.1 hypothetical protein EYR40_010154 [Pleurotus pulmonarius]